MKKSYYNVLRVLFILLFIYFGGTFLISFFPIGFADFPCSIEYDQANKCVIDYHGYIEDKSKYQIETFLTTSYVGMSGGGCHHAHSDSNVLDLKTSFSTFHLERTGNNLIVNSEVVEEGEEFQQTNYLHWSPWIVSRIKFKNIGAVTYCNAPSDNPRVAIIGDYGAEKSLVKGLVSLLLTISGYVLTNQSYQNASQK